MLKIIENIQEIVHMNVPMHHIWCVSSSYYDGMGHGGENMVGFIISEEGPKGQDVEKLLARDGVPTNWKWSWGMVRLNEFLPELFERRYHDDSELSGGRHHD